MFYRARRTSHKKGVMTEQEVCVAAESSVHGVDIESGGHQWRAGLGDTPTLALCDHTHWPGTTPSLHHATPPAPLVKHIPLEYQ